MKVNKIYIILFIALIIITMSGCKLSKKSTNYTTTLEGIAIHVPSLTGGIINKLLVDEGAWIAIGDTLAILDTREIRYQIEQLDASLKELNIQSAIAKNNQQQSQQDLSYVSQKQQRTQRLVSGDVLPQQNVDDIGNLMQKSQTMVSNANSQFEMLTATAEKLQAQKKILLKKINDSIIISPAQGKVTSLYYRQGEAIAPFANLLEVIDTHSLQAKIYVSEALLSKIKTGQTVNIITESGQKFPAKIAHVINKAEFTPKTILTPDTRTSMVYAVTIKTDNPQDILKDGMPIEVEI